MDFTENHFAFSSSAVPEASIKDNEDLYSFLFQGSENSGASTSQQQQQPTAATTAAAAKAETYPAPVLLSSSSFSYRQLSPDRPPKMPSFNQTLPPLQPVIASVNVSAPVPAAATLAASSEPSSDDGDIWLRRFQQLQQLQQQHHLQQHQLLSSTLLATADHSSMTTANTTSTITSHRSSSSERSVSPASSSRKGDKEAMYPSPPLQDDMDMDSDSEDHAQNDIPNPTPSQLKKMTPKERRQLRNKLSARNFRVRRKEYIGTLESQVKEARKEAADLQRRLIQSELNCQFLRQELETARLSQSLFTDGRMSKEHANLLASLLNPLTESFPTTSNTFVNNNGSSSSNGGSSSQAPGTAAMPIAMPANAAQEPLPWLDSSLLDSNQPFGLNNASLASQFTLPATSTSNANAPQASMQPFVPFEGDWSLLINRAEVPDPTLDPKEELSEAVDDYKNLLSRYEAARREEEFNEQMRTELKAHSRKRLEDMYMVSTKDEALAVVDQKSQEETLMFQGLVYVMMLHLTSSLFQAATMSNTELVNMYQTMDGPLRQKMILGQQQLNQYEPGWVEWREGWIRKHWPSFYNNRRRLCELFEIKSAACGIPDICSSGKNKKCKKTQQELDSVEVARKMEEGVKGKTVEVQRVGWFVRHYLPTRFKCPEILERERLEDEARAHSRSQKQKLAEALAKVAASNVTPVA